jgi:hypothetical protein
MLTSGKNLDGQFNRIGRGRFALVICHAVMLLVGAGLLAKTSAHSKYHCQKIRFREQARSHRV